MFCRKCGIKFDDNSTFCPDCGEKVVIQALTEITDNQKPVQKPFREDFYKFVKSFSFLLLTIIATVYFTINVINSFFHFSSSEIVVSLIGCLYPVMYLGLIIPSLWMLFSDRSPHSAFVPVKLCAFINILKLFLSVAFAVLCVMSAKLGKAEISNTVLYIAEENLSVYLVTLLSEAIKSPSFMLASTCAILWTVYVVMSILYNVSLIRLLNSVSKRINGNDILPSGHKTLFSLSVVLCVMNFIYAISMYLFIKDDIYNVLTTVFCGLFHMMFCVNLRKLDKIIIDCSLNTENKE